MIKCRNCGAIGGHITSECTVPPWKRFPEPPADPAPYADAIRQRHGWVKNGARRYETDEWRKKALEQVAQSRRSRLAELDPAGKHHAPEPDTEPIQKIT